MKNKICLIKQPAGIGDIFFCQKIGQHYKDKGYDIVWPVLPFFNWFNDYMGNFNYPSTIEQFEHKDIYNTNNIIKKDDFIFLPLQNANARVKHDLILPAKYDIAGVDNYNDWKDYFNFKRDIEKENDLYYHFLGLKDDEEYNFINNIFASPPNEQTINITLNNGLKNIFLRNIEGFNVFDWCKVLENASNIHMVDTCFTYIIEKINTNANELHLYSRIKGGNSYNQTKFLWEKNWTYHD